MSYHNIDYDLNLFGTDSENSSKLEVSIEISTTTTDMKKGIHKTALTGKQMERNNEPDIYLDFHPLNATIGLPRELILKVIVDLTFKLVNSYFLDILPPDNDSRTVCDYIYLLLSLN